MEPFVGQITLVGFNFAPRGWAMCNGQLMSIAQNTALFSLLGTYYGGDGRVTFALPDLRGRMPVHQGTGLGLDPIELGESAGSPGVTLISVEMPMHVHTATYDPAGGTALTVAIAGAAAQATAASPAGSVPAQAEIPSRTAPTYVNSYADPSAATGSLGGVTLAGTGAVTLAPAGGGQPFSNLPPFLGLTFVVALEGVFPARN